MKDDERTEQSAADRPKSLSEDRVFARVTATGWPVLPRLWTAKFRELAGVDFKPETMTCRVRVGGFPSPAGKLVVDTIEWHEPGRRIWIWQIEPPITIDRPECGGELMSDGFWFWWDGLEFYRPAERVRKLGGDVIERTLHQRGWGKQSELPVRGPTELDLCRKWVGEIPLGHAAIVEFDGETWGICRIDVDKARTAAPSDKVQIYQTTMTQHWGDEAIHVSFSHRNFESVIRQIDLRELPRFWRVIFTFEQVLPREVVAGIDKLAAEKIKSAPDGKLVTIHDDIRPAVDQMWKEHATSLYRKIKADARSRGMIAVDDRVDGPPWGEATVPPPVLGIDPGKHVATVVNKWPSPIAELTKAIDAGVVKDTWPATIKPDPEQNRKDIILRWLARIPPGKAAVAHDAKGGHGEWIFDPADLRYGAGQRLSLAPDRKVVLRVGPPAMATMDLTLWELVEDWDMVHPCDPLPPILPASDKTVVVPHEELRKIAQEAMAKVETPLNPLPPACTVDSIFAAGLGPLGGLNLMCRECGVNWLTGPQPRPIDVWRSATGHVDRSGVKVDS